MMNDNEFLIAARNLDSRDVMYDVKLSPTFGWSIQITTPKGMIEITRNTTIGELYHIITMCQPKPW